MQGLDGPSLGSQRSPWSAGHYHVPGAASSGSERTRTGTTPISGFSLLSQYKKERAAGKHNLCLTQPELNLPGTPRQHFSVPTLNCASELHLLGSKS